MLHLNRRTVAGRNEGFTLLELLLAIAILAIALLVLATVLTDAMVGIRSDGRRTVANQVATSVIEDIRVDARLETPVSLANCTLPCDETGEMEAGGQTYGYRYTLERRLVDASGDLTPTTSSDYHVLEVDVTVTTPEDRTYAYTTLVARNPSAGSDP